MIACQEIELLLAEYAAGELTPALTVQVDSHLAQCKTCRAELAREKEMLGLMSGLPHVACPDRVTAAILAATDPGQSPLPWYRGNLNRPAVAGLVAAVLALAALLPHGLDLSDRAHEDFQTYTPEEIRTARREATVALLFAGRIVTRGERETARQIENSLPETLTKTLKAITALGEGGQG